MENWAHCPSYITQVGVIHIYISHHNNWFASKHCNLKARNERFDHDHYLPKLCVIWDASFTCLEVCVMVVVAPTPSCFVQFELFFCVYQTSGTEFLVFWYVLIMYRWFRIFYIFIDCSLVKPKNKLNLLLAVFPLMKFLHLSKFRRERKKVWSSPGPIFWVLDALWDKLFEWLWQKWKHFYKDFLEEMLLVGRVSGMKNSLAWYYVNILGIMSTS